MNWKMRWMPYVLVIVLLGVVSWSVYGQRRNTPNPTFEYKIVYEGNGDYKAEERIAPLGAQGWELVEAEKVSDSSMIIFIFKRAR